LATAEAAKGSSRTRFFERYENDVDDYGFNLASYAGVERLIRILYKKWFGVQIAGLTNIPAKGSALLFGNHSGVLPVDGLLLYDGIINLHPEPRRVRFLVSKFLLRAPVIGKFLRGFGCIPPDFEIATERLRKHELVFFYPEAEKGTGKLFKDRYKLVDFHSGFVRAALATGSPLIPIVTIGGDEIYPLLGNIKPLAKLLGAPYFPMTPLFPWLPFPLNAIPLPIKIMTCVWRPFKLAYPPEAADDENLVAEIVNDIHNDLQSKVNDLLEIRTGPFKRWNMNRVNAYLESTNSHSPCMERHLHRS
ncbi:MAG: 1-acyl-sn-glycerol-3-phosphate acyltransferase, partial [Candidatus Obscuribacterales bacterium]|nr:1-acyl-sn-glycerol-3-phosphate acyltransferase [Candidatus Obscuribacterales bacterium]